MQNGKIGVTTENIFPIIKKFLYSDHEIFLRELVSNAVDATQKLKTLASTGDYAGELGDLTVHVTADAAARTLTISDAGIGMTAEEVDRYINQIAFSGAEEFMSKYKNQNIIGHFGLGFYSAFMVADKVEIVTQSYREEAPTVVWSCGGTPEFTMTERAEKRSRGTDIILYLSEESAEFADQSRIRGMLRKYCRFLPIPIACGKVQEWKDGKYVDTERDDIVNDTDPLWTHNPADVTDEQYREFYRKLYPGSDDPLFWIHLNIDYPFHLTGILYFPKIHNNFEIQKNRIQLYSNQVYVTDKVADKLQELFNTARADFEGKWDDLKIFIEYGIVTDEKFAEKAEGFMLLKNTAGSYFTLAEYRDKVKENQTDRNGTVIYIYTDDAVGKHSFVRGAEEKGYDVLLMDGQLDNHFVSWYENKEKGCRFVRVDSDVAERLIDKETSMSMSLSSEQQDIMRPVFESQLPTDQKIFYNIAFEAMAPTDAPVTITQDEYMRRMKEMAAMSGGGMSQFYSQMLDNYTIAVNANHPLVIDILGEVENEYGEKLKTINKKIETAQKQQANLNELIKDKKEADLTEEEKQQRDDLAKKVDDLRGQRTARLKEIGAGNSLVKQLIDLALLSNGMLKGEQLTNFIKRSVELIGK